MKHSAEDSSSYTHRPEKVKCHTQHRSLTISRGTKKSRIVWIVLGLCL